MQKLLSVLILSLFSSLNMQGQLSITVLDTVQSYYKDIKLSVTGNTIACLKTNYALDLRSYSGSDFGALQSTTGLTGFYEKLQIVGNYAYALGHNIKPIDISNASTPVLYPETFLANDFRAADHWTDMLYALGNIDGFSYRLQVFSLGDPSVPQLVDSLVLPADGDIKVSGNKLYYFWSQAGTGDRIRIFTLSNTAPYLTLTDSLILNQSTNISLPSIDVSGAQLLAKTTDTLYRFRIGPGGGLQLLSKMPQTLHAFNMAAIDTNTICYAEYGAIYAGEVPGNTITKIDSVSDFSTFIAMDRLGDNIFYLSLSTTVLINIKKDITGMAGILNAEERVFISPNPAASQWNLKSAMDGTLCLYGDEGRLIRKLTIRHGLNNSIDAANLLAGVYYYTINFTDQGFTSGKLVKY